MEIHHQFYKNIMLLYNHLPECRGRADSAAVGQSTFDHIFVRLKTQVMAFLLLRYYCWLYIILTVFLKWKQFIKSVSLFVERGDKREKKKRSLLFLCISFWLTASMRFFSLLIGFNSRWFLNIYLKLERNLKIKWNYLWRTQFIIYPHSLLP